MLKSPIFSRILLLGLLSILVWVIFISGKELFLYGKIREEISLVEMEISILKEENISLIAQKGTEEDLRATELEARKRLNVKKPNEKVVIIIPGDEEAIIARVLNRNKKEVVVSEEGYDLFAEIGELWNYIFK